MERSDEELEDMRNRLYGPIDYRQDPLRSLIGFGWECGKGWHSIIQETLEKLYDEILKPQDITDFRITQIKEKFGSLCIYTNYSTDEIDKIIKEAVQNASVTCEKCGEPGKLYTDNWFMVKCDKCKGLK